MAKVVIYLFHGDPDSLGAGSHVAERVRQVAAEQGVELEVFCFGPAQTALLDPTLEGPVREYNVQIDELIAAGVPVAACLNAARAHDAEDSLRSRGVDLQYARDAFVRYATEAATVMSF